MEGVGMSLSRSGLSEGWSCRREERIGRREDWGRRAARHRKERRVSLRTLTTVCDKCDGHTKQYANIYFPFLRAFAGHSRLPWIRSRLPFLADDPTLLHPSHHPTRPTSILIRSRPSRRRTIHREILHARPTLPFIVVLPPSSSGVRRLRLRLMMWIGSGSWLMEESLMSLLERRRPKLLMLREVAAPRTRTRPSRRERSQRCRRRLRRR